MQWSLKRHIKETIIQIFVHLLVLGMQFPCFNYIIWLVSHWEVSIWRLHVPYIHICHKGAAMYIAIIIFWYDA